MKIQNKAGGLRQKFLSLWIEENRTLHMMWTAFFSRFFVLPGIAPQMIAIRVDAPSQKSGVAGLPLANGDEIIRGFRNA
ncbi:MAG: hypothetical protein ACU0CA_09540 [Paracoccaceae bacterium]